MPLARINERETITLTNFSFADGEVNLVHPRHIPYQTFAKLLYTSEGLEEYLEFCVTEGVTSPEDFVFLIEMMPSEAIEFQDRIAEYVVEDVDAAPGGDSAPKRLSDAEEAVLAKFTESMGLLPDSADPFAPEEDGDDGEGDGLASV